MEEVVKIKEVEEAREEEVSLDRSFLYPQLHPVKASIKMLMMKTIEFRIYHLKHSLMCFVILLPLFSIPFLILLFIFLRIEV